MEFDNVRYIKPQFTKLTDLLSGKAKANYQLQDIVWRAETWDRNSSLAAQAF
jgi:hypothetical protein